MPAPGDISVTRDGAGSVAPPAWNCFLLDARCPLNSLEEFALLVLAIRWRALCSAAPFSLATVVRAILISALPLLALRKRYCEKYHGLARAAKCPAKIPRDLPLCCLY